jgi:signal transduction histidine kinase
MELRCRIDPPNAESAVLALLTELTAPDSPATPAADRISALRRALARYHELDGVTPDPALASRAERRLASETIAAGLLSGAGTPSRLVRHPSRVLFPLGQGKSDYGVIVDLPRGSALLVFTTDTLTAFLRRTASAQLPPELHVRIASPEGSGAAEPNAPRLVDAGLGPGFPGWRLHGYLDGDHALDDAAQQQIALYAWIGILAICLLVAAGATSIQLLSREIRFHRLKNDFVATVTHELKTPLASSRVLVDTLLENGAHDAQQRTEYLEMIARENARLTGLIERFLTFSRMERGKHSVALEACDPADLVTRAVEAVQMHCLDGTAIAVDLEPDLPPLEADPDAVVTVLVNLLDNAVKYSGEPKHIGIRAWQQDETIRFAVHDNGVGIPRRARKRIFAKFYQVDRSLSRSVGGCGLGLSIVDYLVRQHKGHITVDSKPGTGSTFTVTFPLAP